MMDKRAGYYARNSDTGYLEYLSRDFDFAVMAIQDYGSDWALVTADGRVVA
jgi:hypothetical protein